MRTRQLLTATMMASIMATGMLTSCTSDDEPDKDYTLRVLTFEDADYLGTGNYLGNKDWSSLIDNQQYGGNLLYGDMTTTPYKWHDDNNTELCAAIDPKGEGLVYWSGGEAISNYKDDTYATNEIQYTDQLATPTGGHAGSRNFCVHNGHFDGVSYNEPSGGIWFADGTPRVIDHMYVSLTSYALSVGIVGNAFTPKANDTDWVKLVAIGTDMNGQTHETTITMCENGKFVTDWVRWDLAELGEIVRLDFNVTSSMMGQYGLNLPGYFAYDDVAVRFKK